MSTKNTINHSKRQTKICFSKVIEEDRDVGVGNSNVQDNRTQTSTQEKSIDEPVLDSEDNPSQPESSILAEYATPAEGDSEVNGDLSMIENITNAADHSKENSTEIVIINDPFHPGSEYPFIKTKTGNRTRCCQSQWFTDPPPRGFPWLHFRPENNTVICYICANNYFRGNLTGVKNTELRFITTGFSNWKKAIDKFNAHQESHFHQTSFTFEITVPKCKNIINLMNTNAEELRETERKYPIKVMECVKLLARQGIAFQGNHDGNDNFTQLLLFHLDAEQKKRLSLPRNNHLKKYSHHDFQNEMSTLMSRQVLLKVLDVISSSPFYAIMADEYTSVSNKEHVSICVRSVDCETLTVKEDFCGY